MTDLEMKLIMNNIREWKAKDHAYFADEKGNKVLGFQYEDRIHMFSNLDVILSFEFEKEM
jgi:hypothetical protein